MDVVTTNITETFFNPEFLSLRHVYPVVRGIRHHTSFQRDGNAFLPGLENKPLLLCTIKLSDHIQKLAMTCRVAGTDGTVYDLAIFDMKGKHLADLGRTIHNMDSFSFTDWDDKNIWNMLTPAQREDMPRSLTSSLILGFRVSGTVEADLADINGELIVKEGNILQEDVLGIEVV
jgi:hypothetical protein